MRKGISILLLALMLLSNTFQSFAWQYTNPKDGKVYNIPDGVQPNITVGDKKYNLNFEILKDRGLCVYGDYSNIAGNEKKGNEWRYLGFDMAKNKYTNELFPNDADSGRKPWEKNWIKEPWRFKLVTKSKFNDDPNASKWLDLLNWKNGWTGEKLKDYLVIQSPPSEYVPGSAVGYHKTSDGRVWYQTFTIPAQEKVEPQPVVIELQPDYTTSQSKYSPNARTYYLNTLDGKNEGEQFNVANASRINGMDAAQWISKNPGYTVEYAWSANPAGIIDISGLSGQGGTSRALKVGQTSLTLNMVLKLNGAVQSTKSCSKTITVFTEKPAQASPAPTDFSPFITAPASAKVNETFTVQLQKSSVINVIDKISNIKWYIGDSQDSLAYHPELDKKFEFTWSAGTAKDIYFKADVATPDATKPSNTALTRLNVAATAKAKIDIPDEVYEGVFFGVSTAGSRVYANGKSYSLKTADEEGYAGYEYEASAEYFEDPDNELDAGGGRIYFDTLGEQWMKLWVYPSNGDDVYDTDYTTVLPTPKAVLEVTGQLKENRVVTIDASKSLYHIKHPRVPGASYIEITKLDTGDKFTVYEGQSIVNDIVKTKTFNNLKMDLHFTTAGSYSIKFFTQDDRGNTDSTTKTIIYIRQDTAPLADFYSQAKQYREASTRKANIEIISKAKSLDGDILGSQKFRYRYDSDNDGSFTDETWVNLTEGYEFSKATLTMHDVGKIEVELTAKEEPVGAVIPEFFDDSCKKSSVTTRIIDVDNIAPITSLMAVTEKEQDILILSDDITTANNKKADLQAQITGDPNYLLKPTINTGMFSTSTDSVIPINIQDNMGNYTVSYLYNVGDGFAELDAYRGSSYKCAELKDYFIYRASSNGIEYFCVVDKENYNLQLMKRYIPILAYAYDNTSFDVDMLALKGTNSIIYRGPDYKFYHYNMDSRKETAVPSGFNLWDKYIQDSKYLYCASDSSLSRVNLSTGQAESIDLAGLGVPQYLSSLRLIYAENGTLLFFADNFETRDNYTTLRRRFYRLDENLNLTNTYTWSRGESRYSSKETVPVNIDIAAYVDDYVNVFFRDAYTGGGYYQPHFSFGKINKTTGAVIRINTFFIYEYYSNGRGVARGDTIFEKIGDYYSIQFSHCGSQRHKRKFIFYSNGTTYFGGMASRSGNMAGDALRPSQNIEYIYTSQTGYTYGFGLNGQAFDNLADSTKSAFFSTYDYAVPVEKTDYEVIYTGSGVIQIKNYYTNTNLYSFNSSDLVQNAFKYNGKYFIFLRNGKDYFYVYTPGTGLETINVGFPVNVCALDTEKGKFAVFGNSSGIYKYKAYKFNGGFFDIKNVIANYNFKQGVNKYIGIYTQNTITYTSQQLNELADTIKAKGARVFFATRSNNKTFADNLTAQTGGRYEYFDTWDADIASFANYIKPQEGTRQQNDRTLYIAKGETVNYAKFFGDFESDPQHMASGEKWLYLHTPSTDGLASFHNQVRTTPVASFDKNGTYQVYFNGRDNPKDDNRFDSCRKWSNATPLTIIVGSGADPASHVPMQVGIDISGDLRQYHRVDFRITAVKGTCDINWSSLQISFDRADFLPYSTPASQQFSRLFKDAGSHMVTVRLKDANGQEVTAAKTFTIAQNLAPAAGFTVTGDGKRNESGSSGFKITSSAKPTDDSIGKIEYYVKGIKYADNGDGSFSPAGEDYFKIEPNEYGEIELDQVGINYIKQVVQEYYKNGIGLAGEDLDQHNVYLKAEMENTANVINTPPVLAYSVNPGAILRSDSIQHIVDITDDTPAGDYGKYKFTHDPDYYQNSNGLNLLHNIETDTPTEILNYKGLYHFYAQAFDENGAFTGWVYGGQVKVCSKPAADFELISDPDLNGGQNLEYLNKSFRSNSIVTIVNKSYNEDYEQTRTDHGIKYIKVEYRNAADSEFTTLYEENHVLSYRERFNLPALDRGIYEVRMTVKSPEGFEDACVRQFNMPELRLDAELEPSTICAGQSYKIKAVLSKDGLGAVAKSHDGTWVALDKSGEDSINAYYEKTVNTLNTIPDASYAVTVYGEYPFGNELKQDLILTVKTPINLVPMMPSPVLTGTAVSVQAATTKHANAVTVILFKGTAHQTALKLTGTLSGDNKIWSVDYAVPDTIADGTYAAEYTARTPNGNIEARSVDFVVESLKITNVTIQGCWNHWRGQVDMFGSRMTDEPHRFLSLERVKINADTSGFAERVVIRFSPELEAMTYTNQLGQTYDYKDDFMGYYVDFPQDSTIIIDEPRPTDNIYWEYTLPLAPSTKTWDNTREREPYKMTVYAYKGEKCVVYEVSDIEITGNIYDLTYIQPVD